jgi:hypothetical protein
VPQIVQTRAALATYMGHVNIYATYWYLEVTADLVWRLTPRWLASIELLQRQRRWRDLQSLCSEHEEQLEAQGISSSPVTRNVRLAAIPGDPIQENGSVPGPLSSKG